MTAQTDSRWAILSANLALVGNVLLTPGNQLPDEAFQGPFWRGVVNVTDVADQAAASVADWLENVGPGAFDTVTDRAGVEYARLFVGPPKALCPPWETMRISEGASCGFGAPTFAMQERLREAGLVVDGQSNQYADHVGIELLYLAHLCGCAAEGDGASKASSFAGETLLPWLGNLRDAVAGEEPDGLYRLVLDYACLLVESAAV